MRCGLLRHPGPCIEDWLWRQMFSDRSLARAATMTWCWTGIHSFQFKLHLFRLSRFRVKRYVHDMFHYVPDSQCWWLLIDLYWLFDPHVCYSALLCFSKVWQYCWAIGLVSVLTQWYTSSLWTVFDMWFGSNCPLLWNILRTYNATCYPFKDTPLCFEDQWLIPPSPGLEEQLAGLSHWQKQAIVERWKTLILVSLRSHSFCWFQEVLIAAAKIYWTHPYVQIYIYMCVCVRVCAYIFI